VLAGGAIRGGVAHGATDADGTRVAKDATSVPDLFATVAARLGLEPLATFDTPLGRPISLTDGGAPIASLSR